jgi:hypothetical protein
MNRRSLSESTLTTQKWHEWSAMIFGSDESVQIPSF